MSEETIVNRVQQTSHFASEGAKLEVSPFSQEQLLQAAIDPVVEQVYQELVVEKQAAQVDSIEEPDDNIGNSIVDVEALRRVLSLSYGEQPESYVQFRARVIAAFKHLGLDTRKHFGE